MYEVKFGVIVCENCYSIPEITILNKNKVQLKCQKCNDIKIKDLNYFEKFRINIDKESWIEMPKCSFNKSHESKSVLYCFQCGKYLCDECINIHKISFEDKNHILIKQKIDSQYYCNKDGHKEYILNRYCILCKDYLCNQCKCNHKYSNFYDFENKGNNKKIKEIIEKVQRCEKIINDEENKLNLFLKEIENKINSLKMIFKDYKERNLKLIYMYKLLINNYKYFNNIRNYNINNNLIINDKFDFKTSEYFIKEKN